MSSTLPGEFHCMKIRLALESEMQSVSDKVEKCSQYHGNGNDQPIENEEDEALAKDDTKMIPFSYDAGYPLNY